MSKLSNLFLSVPIKEQILFARNVSLMSKSGIPIVNSLNMIQQQSNSRGLRTVLTTLIVDVENGQFLSTSLKRFEKIFGALFVNVIRVGEASGTLSENLGFLADELKKKQLLRSKIMSAMLYPIIIVVTTFALSGVLTFVVFPKILPIFDSFNVTLPLSTRIVIASNRLVLHYWPFLILGFIVLVLGGWFLFRIPSVKYAVHRMMLRIPVLGPMAKSIQMAIFARTLSLLLHSGVKIVEALTITSEIMPNLVYQRALIAASEQVKAGSPLGKYLAAYPKLFPMMFSQMLDVSETAGTLDSTLAYLSDYYEAEVDETTRNLVALLEPLLMLVMGGLVGFLAISIILPIYSISQNFT